MDSACILACDIEKVCSQYDENLFAHHVCSSPCSCLLWGAPGMRWSASFSTIDFHHFCVSSHIAPVVSKTRGHFVKGRPWSPASSNALLCVPSLTVCRTAAATRGVLSLPLSKAVMFVGSVIVMPRAVALSVPVADAGTSTSASLCSPYEASCAYRPRTSTVTCTCNAL